MSVIQIKNSLDNIMKEIEKYENSNISFRNIITSHLYHCSTCLINFLLEAKHKLSVNGQVSFYGIDVAGYNYKTGIITVIVYNQNHADYIVKKLKGKKCNSGAHKYEFKL